MSTDRKVFIAIFVVPAAYWLAMLWVLSGCEPNGTHAERKAAAEARDRARAWARLPLSEVCAVLGAERVTFAFDRREIPVAEGCARDGVMVAVPATPPKGWAP